MYVCVSAGVSVAKQQGAAQTGSQRLRGGSLEVCVICVCVCLCD